MSTRTTTLAVALAALVVAAIPAASARAAEMDTQVANVSLHALNLDTPGGQAALRLRLRAAVNAVCGSADIGDLQATADMRTCRADATRSALGQMQVALSDRHHRTATPNGVQISANDR